MEKNSNMDILAILIKLLGDQEGVEIVYECGGDSDEHS